MLGTATSSGWHGLVAKATGCGYAKHFAFGLASARNEFATYVTKRFQMETA